MVGARILRTFLILFLTLAVPASVLLGTIAQAEHARPKQVHVHSHNADGSHTDETDASQSNDKEHQHGPSEPFHSHSSGHLPGQSSDGVMARVQIVLEVPPTEILDRPPIIESGPYSTYTGSIFRPPIA